jgi:aryl-alcohol dehydrogenase-like predicted oxidoreductase
MPDAFIQLGAHIPMSPSTQARIEDIETEFAEIPRTQLRVSRVALGTWAMGGWMWGGTDQRASVATIQAALHQGINLIDTAPAYGFGTSEEIVGTALEGRRSQAVIATKVGIEWRDMKVYRNATRARIMQEIDDSLRRLRTDYIDIYQVHWPDPRVPVEETAEAMRSLYEQGKIRAIGVSNFSVAEMERFRSVAPLHVLQAPYNLFERDIEAQILPYCRANNIATFGYGALCRGLLSGRMQPDTTFTGDDLRRIDPKFQPPRFAQYLDAVRQLDELAQRRFHRRVIHLAVRWMLDQGISVALWGGRHPDQVEPALGVAGWSLASADRRLIERIVNAAVIDPVGPDFMAPPQRP